jgi:hypothetical protein
MVLQQFLAFIISSFRRDPVLNRFEARVFLRAGHPPVFVLLLMTHSNICASAGDRRWGIMNKISNRQELLEITIMMILMA